MLTLTIHFYLFSSFPFFSFHWKDVILLCQLFCLLVQLCLFPSHYNRTGHYIKRCIYRESSQTFPMPAPFPTTGIFLYLLGSPKVNIPAFFKQTISLSSVCDCHKAMLPGEAFFFFSKIEDKYLKVLSALKCHAYMRNMRPSPIQRQYAHRALWYSGFILC